MPDINLIVEYRVALGRQDELVQPAHLLQLFLLHPGSLLQDRTVSRARCLAESRAAVGRLSPLRQLDAVPSVGPPRRLD